MLAQEKKAENHAAAPASDQTAQAQPAHPAVVSEEDAARKNPNKFTDVSVARGKKVFETQCSMCHGANADGKGEMVQEMKINPPDFTKEETQKKWTDGALFTFIGSGAGSTMPGQGSRMADKQKWDIVNFLRAAGGKVPEKSNEKAGDENVIYVPQ
jgi:mono/diheme cytochrome c family protein